VETKIRLARHGRHKRPYYRIVVAPLEKKRSGRHLEVLGTLNTLVKPALLELNEERVRYWVSCGAHPSDTMARLIEKKMPGYLKDLEEKRSAKIRSRRAARKARAKKSK